jgi:hypothetical protein
MSPELSSLQRRAVTGFTLVAVVIAVVALLLGALMVPVATERDLTGIKQALFGFGISPGRLP